MSIKMVDVTLHIDEKTTHDARELLRDKVLASPGVMAAIFHDERPHLLIVEYNPDVVSSQAILETVRKSGVHAELLGM